MKEKLQLIILSLSAFLLFFSGSVLGQNTYALNVNGPKFFHVVDHADLDVTGDFTVEAWISFATAGGRLYERAGVGRIYGTAHSFRFDLTSGGSISTGDISADEGDGLWHHLAVSRSGTSTRIFYDGVEKASFDLALVASDTKFVVGGRDGWAPNWDAKIDEFRFSNVGRYTANFTPHTTPHADDANTILLFHFDDNSKVPAESDAANYTFTYGNGRTDGTYSMDAACYVSPTGLPLPVELTSFTAVANDNSVVLEWATATEVNNYGFEVERAVADEFETIGFVEGAGNSNSPKQYSFVDTDNLSGEVSYRLKQVDADGSSEYSDVVTVNANGLAKTELFQNYPNPFNPTTQISFKLANANQVNVSVYNTLGEKVAELVNEVREAGVHNLKFDASNLSSGFYIYRIETPNYSKTMKMLLIK